MEAGNQNLNYPPLWVLIDYQLFIFMGSFLFFLSNCITVGNLFRHIGGWEAAHDIMYRSRSKIFIFFSTFVQIALLHCLIIFK